MMTGLEIVQKKLNLMHDFHGKKIFLLVIVICSMIEVKNSCLHYVC